MEKSLQQQETMNERDDPWISLKNYLNPPCESLLRSFVRNKCKESASFLDFDGVCEEYHNQSVNDRREAPELTKKKVYNWFTSEKLTLSVEPLERKLAMLYKLRIPPHPSLLDVMYRQSLVFQIDDKGCINFWKNPVDEMGTLDENRRKDVRIPDQNVRIFLKFMAPDSMGYEYERTAEEFLKIYRPHYTRKNVIELLKIAEFKARVEGHTHYSQLYIEIRMPRKLKDFEKLEEWINEEMPLSHKIMKEFRHEIKQEIKQEIEREIVHDLLKDIKQEVIEEDEDTQKAPRGSNQDFMMREIKEEVMDVLEPEPQRVLEPEPQQRNVGPQPDEVFGDEFDRALGLDVGLEEFHQQFFESIQHPQLRADLLHRFYNPVDEVIWIDANTPVNPYEIFRMLYPVDL